MSQEQRSPGEGGFNRRDVLKGMSAAGVGGVGAATLSGSAAGGAVTGGCATGWGDPVDEQIDLAGGTPTESGSIPDSGDLVIFVHGYLGEDIFDDIDVANGATQATALDVALSEQGIQTTVVAGMWEAATLWSPAKENATEAGNALATWVEQHRDAYDSIVVFGHSLGSQVTLDALDALAESGTTITSAGLFGPGVPDDVICSKYADGVRNGVEDGVYSYHSEGDDVVCNLYEAAELLFEDNDVDGLGCGGVACEDTPETFISVDTTDRVEGHCNYFKPETMDFEGESAIPQIVDKQLGVLQEPTTVTITGTVTDDEGMPISGVTVEFTDAGSGDVVESATTGGGGSYTVELSPGEYEMRADAEGYEPFSTQQNVGSDGTTINMGLTETGSKTGTVTGTVLADGEQLGDVLVGIADPETGDVLKVTMTDSAGVYTLTAAPGEYDIVVEEDGFEPYSAPLTVTAGETTTAAVQLSTAGPPPVIGDTAPKDPDGDGLYRDVRGDDEVNVFDVQTLFNNLDNDAVQNNAAAFNFSGSNPDEVTIFDVQALFSDMND